MMEDSYRRQILIFQGPAWQVSLFVTIRLILHYSFKFIYVFIHLSIYLLIYYKTLIGERGGPVVNASDSGSNGRRFEPHFGQTVLCP